MHESEFIGERGVLTPSYELDLKEDKKGLWSGSQVFHCHKNDLGLVRPQRGSAHPDFDWIYLEEMAVSGVDGTWLQITGKYAGATADYASADEGGNDYESGLRLSTTESPLATNSMYADMAAEDKVEAVKLATQPPKNQDGTVKKIDTSEWDEDKVDLYDRMRKGNTHFKEPAVEYYIRFVSDDQPDDLNDIGKIDEPKGAPTPGGSRNYLLTGYNSVQRGEVFEIEKVWQLSGRGGWDEDLYAD